MKELLTQVTVPVNNRIYLKDPNSSELGKKIVSKGVDLIDEHGFEHFTFRKLAEGISSTEASVYRYFESKHRFLLYLTAWYWAWMELQLVFLTANISNSKEKLEISMDLLTCPNYYKVEIDLLDLERLHKIVISESSKAYLTKQVDNENKEGVFLGYKNLVERVSGFIMEINPKYKYPHMLVSTIMEGANHQRFFADHLPRLTDKISGEDSIPAFFKEMVFKSITS